MKRVIALLLVVLLAAASLPVLAEEAEEEENVRVTALEVALYGRPVSEEPTHITVGNTTKVSGSFFTTFFGNNTSDIDVRTMIHGYSPVAWDNQLQFVADPTVTREITRMQTAAGVTYTVTLQEDLVYNDGVTPITAQDYVFAWLLAASPALAAVGGQAPQVDVVGFDAYHAGRSSVYSGVHLLGDYQYSVTVASDYATYFYENGQIALAPCPISVIAPGCSVADNGDGVFLTGNFTANVLRSTLLDPETGYCSHPSLTAGPYRLVSYDRESGVVEFEINPYYKGNYEGVKPVIDSVTLVPVQADTMLDQLASGEVDLLNKCVDFSVLQQGLLLAAEDGFAMTNYARLGYGFLALSCEKGPQQFQAVRQAINYAFDAEAFIREYLGGFGLPVYGYYGLGQWVVGAVNGSMRPTDATPEEEEAWEALSLEELNTYPYDLNEAKRLLIADGWTLNEAGGAFTEGVDAVRYKRYLGQLMPLRFTFAKSADNQASALAADMLAEALPQLGAELAVEEVTFAELLRDYYRADGARKYDMNFMATNFVSTFDPYLSFIGRADMQGAVNNSGLTDSTLISRALSLRTTTPGDLLTFATRWLEMQKRYNEVLPTIPIYSNVYFDFYTDWLQNYYINAEYGWPVAILYAFYGEPPVEEEPEDAWEDDGDFEIFD